MFKVIAIAGHDMKSSLHSFSFYLLMCFFFGVTGYFFWANLSYFSLVSFQAATNLAARIEGLNMTEAVLSPFLSNVGALMLLLVPILSMRSFSEERRQGTLELLYTYPVSETQILLGKYFSMIGFVFVLILPTVVYFPLAQSVGAKFELDSILTGYLGLLLIGASFAALGIFVSALTPNHMVSAGIGFALILFFRIVGWVADWTSPAIGKIFHELSLIDHFRDFSFGVIDTKDIVFYVLFIVFFLFSTLCAMEIRTWKR